MKDFDDHEFKNLIEDLKLHPEVFSRVEPPVGYETQLLKTLNKKLNKSPRGISWQLILQRWNWSVGIAGLALMIGAVTYMQWQPQASVAQVDPMLEQIAEKGGQELVDHWSALQGDVMAQRSIASEFNAIVASVDDTQAIEKVIKKIEKESL